jgi:hypothetical protein
MIFTEIQRISICHGIYKFIMHVRIYLVIIHSKLIINPDSIDIPSILGKYRQSVANKKIRYESVCKPINWDALSEEKHDKQKDPSKKEMESITK